MCYNEQCENAQSQVGCQQPNLTQSVFIGRSPTTGECGEKGRQGSTIPTPYIITGEHYEYL